MQLYINNWSAALLASAAPGAGTISVAPELGALLTGLGSGDFYSITAALKDDTGAETAWEILKVTGEAAGVLTVARAQESTTALALPAGTEVSARLTAAGLEALQAIGEPARGISSTEIDGAGHLIITYTDSTTFDAGYVVGAPGAPGTPGTPGAAGRGITGAEINGSGHLVISYTSGSPSDVGLVVGTNGAAGRGISSTSIDGSGHLIVTYTDSTTADLGKVTGENGTGTGDVVGPAASVDGEVALYSGTTGKLLKRGVLETLVRAVAATGLSLATATAVVATDTLLVALGKLQRQINDLRAVTIPVNSKSAAYTLALTDAGTMIYHPPADTTARTWTIPANSAVAFEIGAAVTFDNDIGAGAVTIAINADTLVLVGAGTTGSRTLAAGGQATAVKVSATRWRISGNGLT